MPSRPDLDQETPVPPDVARGSDNSSGQFGIGLFSTRSGLKFENYWESGAA
jgi:hypothetical protein